MFIRFRQSHRRLKVYITENVRRDGRVRQEIIAYLGSVEAALVPRNPERECESIAGRVAFWETANPKLKNLANRLGPDQQRLRMAVHARIPWAMQAERERLEVLRAQAKADLWHRLYGQSSKMIEANEELIAKANEQNSELRRDALREIAHANEWAAKASALQQKR
jgi:hypothetical protein